MVKSLKDQTLTILLMRSSKPFYISGETFHPIKETAWSETIFPSHIMTSTKSSSTERTEPSHSSPSPHSSNSNRNLTGSDILQQTKDLITHGIHYAADSNIPSLCEFTFNKEVRGDILVPKNSQTGLLEFILSGIFQIDARNFFMTSDGKWNLNNPLGTRLDQVKATCHLLPVDHNLDFTFSSRDYPNIIGNLHAIENLANQRRSHDTTSIIVGESNTIKIMHHLFIVCILLKDY